MTKVKTAVPVRMAMIYLIIGLAWIFFSDQFISILTSDSILERTLQTYKGFFFVGTTAAILFFILKKGFDAIEAERDRRSLLNVKLSETEERYRSTLDTMLEGCHMLDFNMRYLYLNEAASTHSIFSIDEFYGKSFFDIWPGFAQTDLHRSIVLCMKERKLVRLQTTLEFQDGLIGRYDVSIQPIPEGVFLFTNDVTERSQSELRIKNLNRLYSIVSNINQLIVRANDIDEIFHQACSIAVNDGQFIMAWIGTKNEESNKLEVRASSGNTSGYLESINIDFNDRLRSSGPTGLTVTEGVHHYSSDIEVDTSMTPWREEALRIGYRSCAAFPLAVKGKVVGALTLYATETNFFTLQELSLLDQLALDISFAMEVKQNDMERRSYFTRLQKSETQYRLLAENMSDVLWILDHQLLRFSYFSPSVEKLRGYTVAEALDVPLEQSISPRSFDYLKSTLPQRMRDFLSGKEGADRYQDEIEQICKDGTSVWTEVNTTYVRNENGTVELIGVSRNINDRVELKNTLRDNEERYRLLFENSGEAVLLTLDSGEILAANPVACTMFGKTAEEICTGGRSGITDVHDPRLHSALEERESTGKFKGEMNMLRRDGTVFPAMVSAKAFVNSKGDKKTSLTISDLTERKQTEKMLKENEEKFRVIFENNSAAIAIIDTDTTISMVNDAYCKIGGFTREEVIGTSWTKQVPVEERDRLMEYNRRRLLNPDDAPDQYEFQFYHKSGELHQAILSVSLIPSQHKIVTTFVDITDLKRAEEAVVTNEKRLQQAELVSKTGNWELHLETNSIIASLGAKTIYGVSGQEFNYENIKNIVLPNYRTLLDVAMNSLIEKNIPYDLEFKIKAKDTGAIKDIHSVAIFDPEKKIVFGVLQDISDRTQAEEALEKSRKEFQNYFDSGSVGLSVTASDRTWIEVNQRLCRMFGYTKEELIGTSWLTLTHPDDAANNQELFQQVLNGAIDTYEIDKRFVRKDGGIVYVSLSVVCQRNNDGTVNHFLSSYVDITDRTRMEEALRENEFLLREAQRVGKIGSYVLEFSTNAWASSDVLNAIFGIDENAERTVASWNDIVHPEDREKMLTYFLQEVVEQKQSFDKEYRIVRLNDGTTRWVWGRGELMFSSDGTPLRMIGSIQDISDRKAAESNLRKSEEKFRNLFENSPIGNSMTGVDGSLFINKSFCTMLGYTQDEIKKMNLNEITHPDDRKKTNDLMQALKSRELQSGRIEKRYIHKNGGILWAEVSTYLQFDTQGAAEYFITTVNDITDRKKAEKEREQFFNFFQTSTDIMVMADPQGCFRKMNPYGIHLLGYTEEELIARPFIEFVHPDDLQRTVHEMAMQVERGYSLNFENRYRCRDGKYLWLSWIATYVAKEGTTYATARDITARKLSEVTLLENEERLRLSLSAANQGLYDLNVQTGETIVSSEYATMLGYDPTTFIETNENWIERLHPDDKKNAVTAYDEYISGKTKEYRIEFRQQTQLGGWKWILSVGRIIEYSPEGKPLRMLGTHTDINQLKQAEEMQLLQTTALESAANAIVITNLKGRIVWVNNAFTKITGYSLDEAIGGQPNLLKSGKQSHGFYKNLWETILSGNVWSDTIINKRKDGTFYFDEMTITPVRNSENVITHFVAVKQDVTERKKYQQQIEEQAMLLNEAHDAIIVRDMNHVVQYWNKGAERLFGWSADEVIGKDLRSILYPGFHDYDREISSLVSAGNYSGEFTLQTKNRHNIMVDIRLNLIFDETGKPKSILSISTDITEKKKIESQFLRTQRMGSLGTLAGGIAHDLNNVLAPILLSVEVLKKTYVNDVSQKILETVESSTRRGTEIVKQILTFARGVETQKVLIQPKHLVKEIVTIFKETFPRNISIVSDIPNTIWTFFGDPTHFHQLIMNLGVNARDAMQEGGTLSIAARNESIDEQYVQMNIDARVGKYVMFSVTDTGTGMSSQTQDHIFEPFFTTKEIGKGTGLGLSTVYTIVRSHNGFIKVYSEMGKGTKFNIYLPAAESSNAPQPEKIEKSEWYGNGELVLVVDDEESIRNVTKYTLEAYHYTVITASNGAEAVARYSENREKIALVLTDMMMPVMDGNQLIITLRKINPDLKIIATSGLIDVSKNLETGLNSVNGFLDKPFTAEKLMKRVDAVIHGIANE